MEQFLLEILAEFLATCEAATNKVEIDRGVAKAAGQLGLEHFAMALLPLRHERLDSYFVLERWPRGWFERYLNFDYFHADPIASFVRQTGRPAVWSRALDRRAMPAKAKRIMGEAGEFGLVDGLTIPLYSPFSLDGLFSVAGNRPAMTSQETKLLQIIGDSAHARLNELEQPQRSATPPAHITRAESQCLTWCVAGKTDREIALLTGRSPRTVQAHLQNLQRKLSAANRAQLIAEAFRRGLQR